MTGRIPFGFLTLLTVLVCAPIQAQAQMAPPAGYSNGVQPAGFHMQDAAGQYNPPLPPGYQAIPPGRSRGISPQTVFQELPDDLGLADEDTPLGRILTDTLRRTWFRGEYLLWTISGPGNVMLGQQTLSGVQPVISGTVTPVTNLGGPTNVGLGTGVSFSQTVDGITGTAQSPSLDNMSINNLNGFRGTFGLPFEVGDVELSSFVLGASSATIDGSQFIQPQIIANPAVARVAGQTGPALGANGLPATNGQVATFISQAALLNGARSNTTFINYDVSYNAKLTTSAWGSEANFVMISPDPNSLFQVRPTFGFRYFNIRDRLVQSGQYNEPSAADPTVNTIVTREINSAAINNLAGPQIGLRTELTSNQFLIGFEPKLMMGLNSYQTNLNTANVFSSTDPAQSLVQHGTTFSPMVDLKVYGNVAMSKNVSAFIAYNFIWAGNINRSFNDIIYNKNSLTNDSAFSIDRQFSNATLQGLSVGLDFRY